MALTTSGTFTLNFTKMHGIGNDFVVVDGLVPDASKLEDIIPHLVLIGDRRFGVGYDQFLYVAPSDAADFQMKIYNPDGSEAEMCGNGIRAFAKFVYDRGYTRNTTITVETLGGIKTLEMHVTGKTVDTVKVDMGEPGFNRSVLPMTGDDEPVIAEALPLSDEEVIITAVSTGNPHAIYFVDTATEASINRRGPQIENHQLFPRRINVHEIEILSPSEVKMLTWERGAGRTLACGTGACASVVAANKNGLTDRKVTVHLAGGDLLIDWADDGHIYMTGAAAESFTGTMTLPAAE